MNVDRGQAVDYIIKIYIATSIFFSLYYLDRLEVDKFTFYRLLLSFLIALFNLPNYLVVRKYFIKKGGKSSAALLSTHAVLINIIIGFALLSAFETGYDDIIRFFLHLIIFLIFIYSSYLITIEKFCNRGLSLISQHAELFLYFVLITAAYAILILDVLYAQELSLLIISLISLIAGRSKLIELVNSKRQYRYPVFSKLIFKRYVNEYLPLQLEVVFGFGSIFLTYLIYRKLNGINGLGFINALHSSVLFIVSLYYTLLVHSEGVVVGVKDNGIKGRIVLLLDIERIKCHIIVPVFLVGNELLISFAGFDARNKYTYIAAEVLLYIMLWQAKIGVVYKLSQKHTDALLHNIGVFFVSVIAVGLFPSELGAISILLAFVVSNVTVLAWMLVGLNEINKEMFCNAKIKILTFFVMIIGSQFIIFLLELTGSDLVNIK